MTSRILFVCLGNICRSPAAEGVMRALAPDLALDSAGTADWHRGKPPYGPMQEAASARQVDLSDLRARQFSPADFGRFDLILAMDRDNLSDIERLRPAGSDTPVRLFAEYADWGVSEVPDPYYTRDFDGALDLIEAAARGLLDEL
ncbi:low molecular weight protein-tyrosine-phosphatase [Thalassovita aquimarina]|uniref:protein-tyrosine-phosphatase n=1 Tax=Thalassovita aquimarina TaxID=2785917 RepID=A0ABS5HPU1_9RHOB|nr:low molecular weight protein-tyrosine-phosphatase [Thalassovita aquimarina]MBR9650975.1 low molecular weight phosphotyrosine protein phosphatase [Thalassovita aquimarina]